MTKESQKPNRKHSSQDGLLHRLATVLVCDASRQSVEAKVVDVLGKIVQREAEAQYYADSVIELFCPSLGLVDFNGAVARIRKQMDLLCEAEDEVASLREALDEAREEIENLKDACRDEAWDAQEAAAKAEAREECSEPAKS
jgi:hypothetical protein